MQAPGLSEQDELLADHFNKIQSHESFAILVTMFRLYNVTGSVKIQIIGIEVKPKFTSNGSFVRGSNTVTEKCAESLDRLTEY